MAPRFQGRADRLAAIEAIGRERVIVLDGAWGSLIQGEQLTEQDFRGARFGDHAHPLKGNNDLLCLTRPDLVARIHTRYAEAGADIASTNTFNATSISQADYGLEDVVHELNVEAARIARQVCDAFEARDGAPRLVAGAVGPTNKTLSLSPDVGDPARRDLTFAELAASYADQIRGLTQGGADVLLIETIFDTLNAKAAIFAAGSVADETGIRLPLMISGTITDLSGRTLSGQTVEAFWHSIRHAEPWSVGLNCALGPRDLDGHVRTLARIAGTRVSAHPNAGLPNAMGGYDEGPREMLAVMAPWVGDGVVNVMGGCCGTTPVHIAAFARAARAAPPRASQFTCEPVMRLSGLEPFTAAA